MEEEEVKELDIMKSAKQEIAVRILVREQLRKAAGIKTCDRCHGAGWIMGKPTRRCPKCAGTGKLK